MSTSILYSLKDLTKTYKQKGKLVAALKNVDLDIARGEFVSIQGPTGGGKSTLLQMLGGLDQPTSGKISLGDDALESASFALASRPTRAISWAKPVNFGNWQTQRILT